MLDSSAVYVNNKLSCHSEVSFRSIFYCVEGATAANTQVIPAIKSEAEPKEAENVSHPWCQVCEERLPLEFESPNYLFFNKCRQRSVDPLCATQTSAVATLELHKENGVDCLYLSDDVEFNQGDLDISENGYSLTFDIP